MSKCIVCNQDFKVGDYLQAFLRCPDDPKGSWTKPALVNENYQKRSLLNKDSIKRKHINCNTANSNIGIYDFDNYLYSKNKDKPNV